MGPLCSFSKENESGSIENGLSKECEVIDSAEMEVDLLDLDLEEGEIMEWDI